MGDKLMATLRVKRKPYTRSDGTHVKGTTFKTPDKGKKGRTPKKDQWYRPSVHTGWSKDDKPVTRRRKVLVSHKGDLLAAGRSMQALSNISTDKTTARLAGQDARYFFNRLKKGR